MTQQKFLAGATFPEIQVPTLEEETITLGKPNTPFDWKMVVVYRGQHCPLCTRYLNELETLAAEYNKIGVDVVAVSADSKAQLEQHKTKLNVSYPLAHGLTVEQMQQLGLYLSVPRSEKETDHVFVEPAIFVINAEGKVQVLDMSNGPFARPDLKVLLQGLSFIRNPENNYPIRGTY